MSTPGVAKELYKFIKDGSESYTVTNADEEESYLGDIYLPVAIGRSETEAKGDMARQNLTVSFGLDNLTAQSWFIASQDFPITLTVYGKTDDEYEVEWKGRLTGVAPKNQTMDFTFENVFTSMRRTGLRQVYQISCPFALYSTGCALDKDDFAYAGTVTLVVSNVVTVPEAASEADGFFNGGIFADNAGNLRMITSHVGDQITLIRALTPLVDYVAANGYSGLTCTLYPGCDRSAQTCLDKFDNLENYGGFPFMPADNPFENSIV